MFGNHKNHDIGDRAEHLADEAADELREFARGARHHADDVKGEAVRLLNEAADGIRHEARKSGARGEIRSGADDVAHSLERAAHYLKHNSYGDIRQDVDHTAKADPWRLAVVVFFVGLVVGLLLRGEGSHPAPTRRPGNNR